MESPLSETAREMNVHALCSHYGAAERVRHAHVISKSNKYRLGKYWWR